MKKRLRNFIKYFLVVIVCFFGLMSAHYTNVQAKSVSVSINMNGGWYLGQSQLKDYFYGAYYGEGSEYNSFDSFFNGYSYPYRKGYAFVGFCFDKKGTKPVGSEENVYRQALKRTNGKITIYAKWTNKCYKVTFVPGKKGVIDGDFKNSEYIGQTHKKVVRYIIKGKTIGSGIAPYPYQVEANRGYKFIGWYRDKKFKHKVNLQTFKPKKNIKLYARYKKV